MRKTNPDCLCNRVPRDTVGTCNHNSLEPLSYMRNSEGESKIQPAVRPEALADRPNVSS